MATGAEEHKEGGSVEAESKAGDVQPEGHVEGPAIGEVGSFHVLPPNSGPPQWMLPFLKPAFDVVSVRQPHAR